MANLMSGPCTCAGYWRGLGPRPACAEHNETPAAPAAGQEG
jgi:hypothetical protein